MGEIATTGTTAAQVGFDKLGTNGVLYHGLEVLGGGAILGGLILGAIGVFIVERQFMKASFFAVAGAVLSFFGFMHGEAIGIAQSPTVVVGYLLFAGALALAARRVVPSAAPMGGHHAVPEPAE